MYNLDHNMPNYKSFRYIHLTRLLFTVDSSKYILIYQSRKWVQEKKFSKLTFNIVHFLKRRYLRSSVVEEPERFYVKIFYVACLCWWRGGAGEAKGWLLVKKNVKKLLSPWPLDHSQVTSPSEEIKHFKCQPAPTRLFLHQHSLPTMQLHTHSSWSADEE